MKKLFLIIFIFALSSCSGFVDTMPKSWKWGAKPRPLTGTRNFPSTDSEYGKGFKDGCGSAWDVGAKGALRDYNDHRYDYKRMQKGSDYQTGWWDGMEQCFYILDWDVL